MNEEKLTDGLYPITNKLLEEALDKLEKGDALDEKGYIWLSNETGYSMRTIIRALLKRNTMLLQTKDTDLFIAKEEIERRNLWMKESQAKLDTLTALRAKNTELESKLHQVSLWSKASLRKIRGMACKDVRRHHNPSDVLEDIYKEANDSVEKIRQLQQTPPPAETEKE